MPSSLNTWAQLNWGPGEAGLYHMGHLWPCAGHIYTLSLSSQQPQAVDTAIIISVFQLRKRRLREVQ